MTAEAIALRATPGASPGPGLAGETSEPDLAAADALCLRLAARHYENFTVASRLLPAALRRHLARLYAFCRTTDDLGDESGGDATGGLLEWRAETAAVLGGGRPAGHPVLRAVRETVLVRGLPLQPFLDLVDANLQDQRVHAYASWPELLAYCRLSAAPVGRMVLGVAGVGGEEAERLSDDVCVGLQLANFAQDVASDAARGRVYLLADDLRGGGVAGAVRAHVERAERLLAGGAGLERMVTGPLRAQLGLYRRGGLAICAAVRAQGFRTDVARPTVTTGRKLRLVVTSLPQAASRRRRDPADQACAAVTRAAAANFYAGFRCLPAEQRDSIHALYTFARQVDDAVDAADGDARAVLGWHRDRLRRAVAGRPDDAAATALARAVRRHAIPAAELEALVDGVEQDLTTVTYATWEELAAYCRLVASTIGRMCVRTFGFADLRALERADELGMALQLTNILRDVREDAGLGRVYLPLEDLERFGVAAADLAAGRPGPGWEGLVHFEADRARALYAGGLRVCDDIPLRAAACVRTMAGIYSALLDRIDADPGIPLRGRLRLSTGRKLAVAARAWLP